MCTGSPKSTTLRGRRTTRTPFELANFGAQRCRGGEENVPNPNQKIRISKHEWVIHHVVEFRTAIHAHPNNYIIIVPYFQYQTL
jgi:hypothetical protein